MKKLSLLLVLTLSLAACGSEEAEPVPLVEAEKTVSEESESISEVQEVVEETEDAKVVAEVEEETEAVEIVEEVAEEETEDWNEILTSGMPVQDDGQLTSEEVWQLTEYLAIGEGDTLMRAEIIEEHIQIAIALGENEILPLDQYAPYLYSQLTDTFLEYGGWSGFTVDYEGIGSITMNRSETVANEYGMEYFPIEVIEGRIQ